MFMPSTAHGVVTAYLIALDTNWIVFIMNCARRRYGDYGQFRHGESGYLQRNEDDINYLQRPETLLFILCVDGLVTVCTPTVCVSCVRLLCSLCIYLW